MQKIFSKPAELEKLAKEKFSVPPFFMMEHAAQAMADFILQKIGPTTATILIICGKGNNGGDGYALGRLLKDSYKIQLVCLEKPTAEEALAQYNRCLELGMEISNQLPETISAHVIVDCIYGIGFHGDLRPAANEILDKMNAATAVKIACDVPSAFYFKADYTITMGEHKTSLFADKASSMCGQIIVANLGLAKDDFEGCLPPDALLIEESDLKLPVRKNKIAHKGTYGHTTVFACDKAGASIIAGTAAMNFGSGLTTILQTPQTDLQQFKISPELMISNSIPPKTTAVVIGPGVVNPRGADIELLLQWFTSAKNPGAVLDAGIFSYEGIVDLLKTMNSIEKARIVLTPHLQELSRFLEKIQCTYPDYGILKEDLQVQPLANNAEAKIRIGKILNKLFPQTTVIMKSANTFIAGEGNIFICHGACPSLAKGGSGDVLAGMVGALLAQGYSGIEGAITAVGRHLTAAKEFGPEAYNLTPFKLIDLI